DYDFTAQMEDYLDAISRNEHGFVDYLKQFYFEPIKGLKPLLDSKVKEIDPREISRFRLGKSEDNQVDDVVVRVGRYGPFVEHGDRKASLPDQMPPDEITLEKALELLAGAAKGEEPMGHDPATGKPIYVKNGRFGPYIQLGDNDDTEKRNASIMKSISPADVNLDIALKLLSLPRTLGSHPELNEPVIARDGRFGPYIQCGSETRSLPTGLSPIDVTYEQAIELLAQPKTNARGGRAAAAKKEPIKVFEVSPVTSNAIQLLDGRYGPYVTDGETNASLPKDLDPTTLTFNQALDLLATRAAMGGSKKKAPRKGAKKAASPKTKAPAEAKKKAAPKKKAAKKKAKKSE
ncbi:MAG: DNA topoisomerase I, partial [Pirellulaceae bacterium]|nr:DNA topoisomerase I [Pirellulaceae bacterium]